jgi:hypothetical protein
MKSLAQSSQPPIVSPVSTLGYTTARLPGFACVSVEEEKESQGGGGRSFETNIPPASQALSLGS